MAGHLGDERVTVQGLEIVSVDTERSVLVVKGAIPGATGGDVIVRPTIKYEGNTVNLKLFPALLLNCLK